MADLGTGLLTRRPSRIEHALAALAVLLSGVAMAILAILVAGSLAGKRTIYTAIVQKLNGHWIFAGYQNTPLVG